MSAARGVVAAGHQLTAEAGADVLRAGGNAVDAAIAAILTSFVAESPLTGMGAGGFMLVHTPSGECELLDFFVQAPETVAPAAQQVEFMVDFEGALQQFNGGPASCGVYGNPAGVWTAAERFGSASLRDLAAPAVELARTGVMTTEIHEFLYRILEPILTHWPQARAIYAPEGRVARAGEVLKFYEFGDAIERLAQDGPDPFYTGEVAQQVAAHMAEHGGTITLNDLAEYRVERREPGRTQYRGREVVTNPPPSSGGLLIADSLLHLARKRDVGVVELVEAMDFANRGRDEEFFEGLHSAGYWQRFLASGRDAVGSTTHIAALDSDGWAVSCTCSNGANSGVVVPGTGLSLNNMLGETDLNPLGLGNTPGGVRVTSMMAPTIVIDRGEPVLALGSAGSNRIRSAILQTIVNLIDHGMAVDDAVRAPRVHFEDGKLQAEPGVNEEALRALERRDVPVVRWDRLNLFFGGVQAVGRDPHTDAIEGGGDPRRGGVAVVV